MSFCTFSKEYLSSGKTIVDNSFIVNYLPELDSNALKVYLYGLYLCQNPLDITLKSFCDMIKMDEKTVIDLFTYLEEYDLCSITSQNPFIVIFNPTSVNSSAKRKFNPEKYSEFNKTLQLLIPKRMISASEYRDYMELLETTNLSQEALLIIIKFCVDIRGPKISKNYILKVANDFIERNILTEEQAEKELGYYFSILKILKELFTSCNFSKEPNYDDIFEYKKWVQVYAFTDKFILETAINSKPTSMKALSKILEKIYFGDDSPKKKKAKKTSSFAFDRDIDVDEDTLKGLVDNPDDIKV